MSYKPLTLTDEEIRELLNLRNLPTSVYGGSYGNGFNSMYDYEYPTPKFYVRHEWVPVLMLNFTVYDCKLCKAHKEKAKGVYCADETK